MRSTCTNQVDLSKRIEVLILINEYNTIHFRIPIKIFYIEIISKLSGNINNQLKQTNKDLRGHKYFNLIVPMGLLSELGVFQAP